MTRTGDSQRPASPRPAPLSRGEGYVALQLGLLAASAVAARRWSRPVSPATRRLGLGMVGAALGLAAWSGRSLGRSLSPLPVPRPGAQLVEQGAYRVVRHPIYAALVLGAGGWSLAHGSRPGLGLTALLALLLDRKARLEERWLRLHAPRYAAYARRVRRFLPGVY